MESDLETLQGLPAAAGTSDDPLSLDEDDDDVSIKEEEQMVTPLTHDLLSPILGSLRSANNNPRAGSAVSEDVPPTSSAGARTSQHTGGGKLK